MNNYVMARCPSCQVWIACFENEPDDYIGDCPCGEVFAANWRGEVVSVDG